jgi:PAS domain S-box-containing protein
MRAHKVNEAFPVEDEKELDLRLFQAIVDNAVDGIIGMDERGSVILMNPAAERLFGYRAKEVIGRNISMLMPEPYRSEHDQYLHNYLSTGKKKIIGIGREVTGLRKDGAIFPMHLAVAEMREGKRRLFAGVIHDLAERKRVEEALQESEERFQQIATMTGEWIWEQDPSGVYIYSSLAVKDILGFEPAEIVGKNYQDLFTREQRETVAEELPESPFIQDRFFRLLNRYRHKDGHEVITESTGEPIYDAEGRLIKWRGVDRDITAQRHQAEELLLIRTYLKNIIDSMPSILVGVDKAGQVTEWNQGAERATGVPAAKAVGRGFTELFPQLESQLANVQEAIRRRAPVRTERLATEKEGDTHYADVMVYPLLANGFSGAVIRVDDITNRVRIEQMMVQTEKMMSVGGLAAGMAHEINNPLSGVLQSCQNIQRRLSPDLPANLRTAEALGLELEQVRHYLGERGILEFIEGIQEAAMRASRIVADMLAFSRRSSAEFSPHRVDELLDAVVRLAASDYDLKKKYDFKQIEIVRDYDAELPPVYCDHTEIEQVFLNLIKNAAQALASGGDPQHRITLRTRREGDYARIEVEDNGPGMEEKIRRRVFEPFFTTKPPGVGTGLGLSVSYFIVTEQHKGTITVSSAPGKGSCFIVHLPFERVKAT